MVFFLLLGISALATAAAQTPLGVIRSGTDRAIEILRSQQENGNHSLHDRRDEILQIVEQYFNFQEMARRALGRAWKDQPPEKQREFVRLFKQLLFNTYVGRVENFTYSDQKVAYDEERIEGNYSFVRTRIIGYKDTDVEVNYRLRLEGSEWKVYDVIVEGISFVNNYRQQFDSILANESFDSVLRRLREKTASL